MKITKEFLKSLTPHQNRWRNYLKHYPEWSGSFADFLALEKVPTKDKMWLISKNIKDSRFEKFQREFALACACRAVDNCEIPKVQELYLISALIVETGDFEARDTGKYRVADMAADRATDKASFWAACWASCREADRASFWASFWAVDRVADWAAERDIQILMAIEIAERIWEEDN